MNIYGEEKPAYLKAALYDVELRNAGLSAMNSEIVFKDEKGAVLLTSKKEGLTASKIVLSDPNGALIATSRTDPLRIGYEPVLYTLFDAHNTALGQIVFQISPNKELIGIRNSDGNVIASVIRSTPDADYEVVSVDNSELLAKVTKNKGRLRDSEDGTSRYSLLKSYTISIKDPQISDRLRLLVLEFVAVNDDVKRY